MANFAYAGPAVQGGGNSWQSNNAAYSQQMNRPSLGGQYASPGVAYSGPAVGNGSWQQNYQQLTGNAGFPQQAPQQQAQAPRYGYNPASAPTLVTPGGGGGIPGSRFGQMGAAYNPQVNAGRNYEYQNPQTGQSYNLNALQSKLQSNLAQNIASIRENALRNRARLGQTGLTNFQPGFYGY